MLGCELRPVFLGLLAVLSSYTYLSITPTHEVRTLGYQRLPTIPSLCFCNHTRDNWTKVFVFTCLHEGLVPSLELGATKLLVQL